MSVAPPVASPGLVEALLGQDLPAVAAALAEATLLLPVADEDPARPPTARAGATADGRRLLWAFTDEEALGAWDRRPAAAAVAVPFEALRPEPGDPGAMIVVNAAGPGALVVHAAAVPGIGVPGIGVPGAGVPGVPGVPGVEAYRTGRPERAAAVPHPLADPEARPPVRRRARQAHARGRAEAARGRLDEALDALGDCVRTCGALGDRLHGAAAGRELAACHARAGAPQRARELWAGAAEVLAALGEPDLAAATWLDAAEAAAADPAAAPDEVQRLAGRALALCAGPALAERLTALWGGGA